MDLLHRVDQVDVLCYDIDKMASYYHDVLGQPFFFPYRHGDEWFALQSGDVTIFFFAGRGGHRAPRSSVTEENPPGIDCIAFAVADLAQAMRELGGKVEWVGEVGEFRHPCGTWYRYCYFYDPEGNKLALTEPHKA